MHHRFRALAAEQLQQAVIFLGDVEVDEAHGLPPYLLPGPEPFLDRGDRGQGFDPEVDVDVVANTARPAKLTAALSNSFGFGGHNSALLIKKYDGA